MSQPAAAPVGGSTGVMMPPNAAAIAQRQRKAAGLDTTQIIDYQNLPPPVRYEELQREALMSLKPDTFEGLRFDFQKPLNQNFVLVHSVFLGNVEVPSQAAAPIKMSMGTYEFGATVASNSGNVAMGRITQDGRLQGKMKVDVNDNLSTKLVMLLGPDTEMSQVMADADLKGKDWNGQLKWGHGGFYGANYFQSVTPNLSAGGEVFWLSKGNKSGTGFAARHTGKQHVATCQLATTGLASLTYVHRVSEKVSYKRLPLVCPGSSSLTSLFRHACTELSKANVMTVALASEFMWNWNQREASAAVGYDYTLRQCRLRGRADTDGKFSAFLEERINVGVNFLLSAEIDHVKKDYKFGFGLTVGE